VIADVDEQQAKKVATEAPHGTVVARHTDVTDWDSVSSTVQFTQSSMGGVDILINCAGWTVDRLFVEKPRAEWEREIAIDTWGFINSVRAVLDPMMQRGYGRIVSIGSDAGRIGEWREAVYSGTKASVIAMSKESPARSGNTASRSTSCVRGSSPARPRPQATSQCGRRTKQRCSPPRCARRPPRAIRCVASELRTTSCRRFCSSLPTARRTSPARRCRSAAATR